MTTVFFSRPLSIPLPPSTHISHPSLGYSALPQLEFGRVCPPAQTPGEHLHSSQTWLTAFSLQHLCSWGIN